MLNLPDLVHSASSMASFLIGAKSGWRWRLSASHFDCNRLSTHSIQRTCDAYRRDLDLRNLRKILLIVYTIPQDVPKIAKRPLQRICGSFFLSFLESSGFTLAILDMAISDILPAL